MTSTSPSPNSSPSAVPPTSSPPPPSDSSTNSPPPSSVPDQKSGTPVASTPSNSSAPPPQSPPSAPPPSPPQSPPPASPPPSPPATPPSPPATPPSPPATPPSTPASRPPSSPASSSPPPSPPASPPPLPPTAPPPAETTPSVPNVSGPPPSGGSPPPEAPPSPPVATSSPPSRAVSPSPSPPANVPRPPSSNSPPPPVAKSPAKSPPSPVATPAPNGSQSAPPPADNSPPKTTLPSPPPSVPSTSSPPATSPPAPPSNSSDPGPPTLPAIPTQKPTAKSTDDDNNVTSPGSSNDSGGLKTGGAVAIGIIVGVAVLGLLFMAVWIVHKKKRKNKTNVGYAMPSPFASSQNSDSLFLRPHSPAGPAPLVVSGSGSGFVYAPSEGGVNNSKSWFTYDELIQATDGFSAQNLLGEGGFGCVYKGFLADGREVAVKQLKIGGGQGEREFRAEVEIISRVHHRHLVSLVGYCISDHQRLLVYDYVPNNTLHYHLHDEGRPVMDWAIRVKVAAGAARGIAYLHEDCHPRIIHRDIKSSNILLDNNYEAQVSDFGLAKLALDTNTHVTTRVMGTFGYMAPEYATSGKLTEKSDVYSFGVVLLELITGRKPVDASQPLGDESLVEWARPLLSQALDNADFEDLVDARLGKNYVETEMFRMIEAAAACIRHSSAKRPRMSQVVRALESMDDFSDLNNGVKPGQSEVFNSSEHSAQIRMFRRMAFGSQEYSTDFYDQSHSSWGSRESREYRDQSSWRSRDQGNQNQNNTVININKSGTWNN
ncbi:hypothetical protein UlMin_014443 [Ulmus minor]